jgi:UTP--glucose-1-phosphate uridylyltransferase
MITKNKKITKAIFPVAGLGTRFLPATKANPKEMLPIVDKPIIQYAVEEAIQAGITDLIFITNHSKRAIEDHFDTNFELEYHLEKTQKHALLDVVKAIHPDNINCIYLRQAHPLGLGHAILCAQSLIGNDPFAVILADDLIDAKQGCLSQMLQIYQEIQQSIIAVEKVPLNKTNQYGIISVLENFTKIAKLKAIVEKPQPADAPSDLGVVGRYILEADILTILQEMMKQHELLGQNKPELQLTDAISRLLTYSQNEVYAYRFEGKRFDCGSKAGYVLATLHYALKHPEVKNELKKALEFSLVDLS